ncbi:MAG: hypothetical protein ACFFDH_20790 [Promethearchaeota archaeon]
MTSYEYAIASSTGWSVCCRKPFHRVRNDSSSTEDLCDGNSYSYLIAKERFMILSIGLRFQST